MTIRKRLFLYSFGIVTLVSVLILMYFTLMVSGLYGQQLERQRLSTLKNIQAAQRLTDNGQLTQALSEFESPTSVAAVTLQRDSPDFRVQLAYSLLEVKVIDEELKTLVFQLYDFFDGLQAQPRSLSEREGQDLEQKIRQFLTKKGLFPQSPTQLFTVKAEGLGDGFQGLFKGEGRHKVYAVGKDQFLLEEKKVGQNNAYVAYIGVIFEGTKLHLLFATAMTPQLWQLNHVIYTSLPMLVTILVLIICLATILYATVLVTPLKKVSSLMTKMRAGTYQGTETVVGESQDEYQQLEQEVTGLYATLERQQQHLAIQNNRQRVFLKASSHQLKTPVTAALLLIDGLLAGVGKYQETKVYLPQVKEQLRHMEAIINGILAIDQQTKAEPRLRRLNLRALVHAQLATQETLFNARELQVRVAILPQLTVVTDPAYFEPIVANVLRNAGQYTPKEGRIEIYTTDEGLVIENYGSQLEADWQEQLFEPFVRPPQSTPGHGLGLYLVAQYAAILGLEVTLTNSQRDSVQVTIGLRAR